MLTTFTPRDEISRQDRESHLMILFSQGLPSCRCLSSLVNVATLRQLISFSMSSNSMWTFNLTTSDGDSSDDDEGQGYSSKPEDKLLKDLDLSSREEALKYTPNPFSIAKINAAARSRNVPSAMFANPQGHGPTFRPEKRHVSQHQEDIREQFRRQVQRSHKVVGGVGLRQTQMGSKAGVTDGLASLATCTFGEILTSVSEACPGSGNTSIAVNSSLSILIVQRKIMIIQLNSSPS
jgi:hypothetical protein